MTTKHEQSSKSDYLNTKDFLWIKIIDGSQVLLGTTDFAQQNFGPIDCVGVTKRDVISTGDELLILESLKSVRSFLSPLSGRISKITQQVVIHP